MGSLSTGINKQLVLVFSFVQSFACVLRFFGNSNHTFILSNSCKFLNFFFYDDDLFFELVSKPFVFFEIQ